MAKNATTTGVEVITWGSGTSQGNGMLHFVDGVLFGGNTGHAAIKLTIPADEEGKRLVEAYCEGPPTIPFELKKKKTVSAEDGDKSVYKESVYEVYFSWWPGEKTEEGVETKLNVHEIDRRSEALGVNVQHSEKWKGEDIELRSVKGSIGSRIISMGVDRVVHLTQVSDKEMEHVLLNEKKAKLLNDDESLNLLYMKVAMLDEKVSNQPNMNVNVSPTINLLINRFASEWKNNLNPEDVVYKKDGVTIESLSPNAIESLMSHTRDKLNQLYVDIRELEYQIDEELIERLKEEGRMTINLGANPDNVVHLPIASADNPHDPKRLNPEKMLQQMRKIVDDGGFDMMHNNCSGTVDSVLAAGCNSKKLQENFKQGAYGVFKNPQEAYLHAKECQQEMMRAKPKGMLEKVGDAISKNNPLKLARNQLIKAMTSGKPVAMGLGGLGLVALAVVSAPIFLISKAANPAQTIKDVDRFRNYAEKRPSPFMKALSVIASGPTHLLLGVPAMIQNGVNNVLKSQDLKASQTKAKTLQGVENEMELENIRNMKPEQQEKAIEAKIIGYIHNEVLQSQINENTIPISEKDPKVAIAKFHEALNAHPNAIPTLDDKTLAKVANFVSKNKDSDLVKQFNRDRLTTALHLKTIEATILSRDLTGENEENIAAKSEALFKALGVEQNGRGYEYLEKWKEKLLSIETKAEEARLASGPPKLPPKTASSGYNASLPPQLPPKTASSGYNASVPPQLPPKTASSGYNASVPPQLPPKTASSGYNASVPPQLPPKTASSGYKASVPPQLPPKTASSGYNASTETPPQVRRGSFVPGYQSLQNRHEEVKKNDNEITNEAEVKPINPRNSTKM
ncbi:hypothetical protein [Candidatus Berkiella aquae]|uniref:Uncharacterized protein n=1 Tax=Candidatus Berkiella aquae TaxID=295108 RepID=A0A0Q9YXX2_9GAMM|nr:hypothetical protein [Candidatus Berkiella aquae]MCS5711452.1 hypothetical protein [Candidatus Berkiella aquae]